MHCGILSLSSLPVAVSTVLGWVLSGPAGKAPRHKLCSVNFNAAHVLRIESEPVSVVSHEDVSLDSAVSSLWDLENLDILDKNSVHDEFLENIFFDKGRYTVRLPFRKHHDTLPDNFDLSVTRLNSLVRHLKKSPELATEYSKVIEDQRKQGIIEEFNPFLEKAEVGKTHYLSHHAVIRQDALTTKVRVVFDGSAQCDPGLPSLNDILETGPSTVPAIFDILLRFRSYKIPLVADIAQAFHQICVSSDDINCLRFLWVNYLNAVEPEIVFMRFLDVVFGLCSSPFLLGGTLQHHIKRYQPDDPAFVEKLLRSLYVDDLISGSNSVKEAFELHVFLKSIACLSEASFHLRKWASSSNKLMSLIHMSELPRLMIIQFRAELQRTNLPLQNFQLVSLKL